MVKGRTSTGFEFEADNNQINNAEFLEDYAEMTSGNTSAVFRVIARILGKEQKAKLYDHIRDEQGNVPVDKLNVELGEIFGSLAKNPETKN